MRSVSLPEGDLTALFGVADENLRLLQEAFGVRITARGGELTIQGESPSDELAGRVLEQLAILVSQGHPVRPPDFLAAVRLVRESPDASIVDFFLDSGLGPQVRRVVAPRNPRQGDYIREIAHHDMVFAVGPAGTGKTYLAVAMAAASLLEKRVKRVVLCRPAVEAGERLGFLPGDLVEKINPYLRPLYDALYDILGYEKVGKMLERGVIEIAPIAFMRGRTLNDAFIILDEAQNTTSEQMKMFLTRIGFRSKAVVTGDVTQIDLPQGKISGLKEAREVLAGIEGISFVTFTERDVVRHPLVQKIVSAYDSFETERDRRAEAVTNGESGGRSGRRG
jgi:phosphate starvation-inducible PhoH-like protein